MEEVHVVGVVAVAVVEEVGKVDVVVADDGGQAGGGRRTIRRRLRREERRPAETQLDGNGEMKRKKNK